MSDTRKAIITTAQVQTALSEMTALKAEISGQPEVTLSFDKGARGKGFAVYDMKDNVVEIFEGKEEAYNQFATWVKVAREVQELVKSKPVAKRGTAKLVESSEPAENAAA